MNICRIISETLTGVLTSEILLAVMGIVILERLVRGKKVLVIIKTYIKFFIITFAFSILADIMPESQQMIALAIVCIGGIGIFLI